MNFNNQLLTPQAFIALALKLKQEISPRMRRRSLKSSWKRLQSKSWKKPRGTLPKPSRPSCKSNSALPKLKRTLMRPRSRACRPWLKELLRRRLRQRRRRKIDLLQSRRPGRRPRRQEESQLKSRSKKKRCLPSGI